MSALWVTMAIEKERKVFTIAAINPSRDESYASAKKRVDNEKALFFCFNLMSDEPDMLTKGMDKWLKKQGFEKKVRRQQIQIIGTTLAGIFEVDLDSV